MEDEPCGLVEGKDLAQLHQMLECVSLAQNGLA